MTTKVLMLGWGFPPSVSGGLDTHVGGMFKRLEDRDGVDIELVLFAEYAPDRERIVGAPAGERDIIIRIGRPGSTFTERVAEVGIVYTHDWFDYRPGSRAKPNSEDVEWVTTSHSLSSDHNIDPPQREVETERRITERCDHLLTVSELLADKVKREYGDDCHVIYNGFSECETTGRDLKEELGINRKVLFFVGRHTDQKGISHLVYAVERPARDDMTLVMGGSGHLTAQFKQFAELLDVGDRIEWAGYVPEKALGDYYASADLFVSPSLSGPFGITIVEALSTGTRIVATESGAAEVLPEDRVIEVEPDSRSIADGVEYGLSLEGEPKYEPYTWDRVVDKTVEYYHSILDGDTDVSAGAKNEVEASDADAAESDAN